MVAALYDCIIYDTPGKRDLHRVDSNFRERSLSPIAEESSEGMRISERHCVTRRKFLGTTIRLEYSPCGKLTDRPLQSAASAVGLKKR